MSTTSHPVRGLARLGVSLAVVGSQALSLAPAAADEHRGGPPNVEVVNLRVDGRPDQPVGIDDTNPMLGWQLTATRRAAAHPCHRPRSRLACPADEQTAYQVQAATSESNLKKGKLIWDSGKVGSAVQAGVRYAGRELESRERVVWRVRVWDADRTPSDWSEPSTWEMGLLRQEDWGPARWIEYPERTEAQPMPIFARPFTVDHRKHISHARLYLSGIGLHLPTLNGREFTDEVLAPGNSNYQLSSEYRTYDLTDELRKGANTLGVQLGNGTAYVRRSTTNPPVGRTAPYSWWQSQLKGTGVLAADVAPDATTVKLDSVGNYHVGGTINIDTGNGGDNLESRVITAIGTAGADGTGVTFTPG
jgi:alpha-L-rhamnosidase